MCKELEKKEKEYLAKKEKARQIYNNISGSLETQEIYHNIMGHCENEAYPGERKDFAKNKY